MQQGSCGGTWLAAGTVFLDVLVWKASRVAASSAPLYRLKGHEGSIHRSALLYTLSAVHTLCYKHLLLPWFCLLESMCNVCTVCCLSVRPSVCLFESICFFALICQLCCRQSLLASFCLTAYASLHSKVGFQVKLMIEPNTDTKQHFLACMLIDLMISVSCSQALKDRPPCCSTVNGSLVSICCSITRLHMHLGSGILKVASWELSN